MMKTIRRSLAFSFLEKYGVTAIGLVGTLVMARLLTPADFGVYSVALSVVLIIDVVRDFGVGTYLVQERQLTPAVVQTVFTVSLAMSVICAGLLLGITLPIAAFYAEPSIAHILPLLAMSFLLGPFSTPSIGLLRRDMQFGKLALVGLAAAAVNLLVTVMLAALGFGYMSLAWAKLASTMVTTVASIACRPVFRAFFPSFAEWRKVATFGSYASATAIINVIHDSLPQLIVGWQLGFGAVGLLGRAAAVCQIPDRLFTSVLQPVLLPSLAEQARTSGDLKRTYLRSITYMSALQWPIFLCLAMLADPAVRVLLGAQWDAAAPIVRVMALASLSLFPAYMTYPVLVAVGAVRDALVSSLISIPPSLLLIFLASLHNLEAVAATQLITGPLQVYVAVCFIRRHVPMTWQEFFAAVGRSGYVALFAAAPSIIAVVLAGFRFDLSPLATVLSCLGAGTGWLAGLWISKHPLLAELQLLSMRGRWQTLRPAWLRS